MALKVPDGAEEKILDVLFPALGDLELRLYSNNLTPANDDVLGDYTETDADGYAAATIDKDNWVTTPAANPPVYCEAVYDHGTPDYVVFTFTGANGEKNLYGYYVVGDPLGTPYLLYAERFSGAPLVVPDALGGELRITLKFRLRSEGES